MLTGEAFLGAVATVAAVGLVGVALFQLAIAAGAPLGRASWGGTHADTLPTRLRVISAVAVVFWGYSALVVLRRGGVGSFAVPEGLARGGTWVLFGLLLVSALANFASPSRWERYFWGPAVLLLAALCFLTARG